MPTSGSTLVQQLNDANKELANLNSQLVSQKANTANVYKNYTSCVEFYGPGNPGAIDKCWLPYKPTYNKSLDDENNLKNSIASIQSQIDSLTTQIASNPAAKAELDAQVASEKNKNILVWTVAIVIVISVVAFIYIKYIR